MSNETALDIVLASYRDMFGVKTDRGNELHRDACVEVWKLREAFDKGKEYLLARLHNEQARNNELRDQIAALRAENDRLREALKWYADPGNYCWDDDLCELVEAYQNGNLGKRAAALLNQEPK